MHPTVPLHLQLQLWLLAPLLPPATSGSTALATLFPKVELG
jgi:hypothetical protein